MSILADKEQLVKAIEGATSKREILERLGIRAAGGNYRTLNKYVEKYELILPEYNAFPQVRPPSKGIYSKPLEEVLTVDSTYNRANLKKRLINAGLLSLICANCGLGPHWNGKPLVLQLEHLNGIWNDNRLENLCLLCPNCHTQTKTYAGKNVAVKNYCNCGIQIHRKSNSCRKCGTKEVINWPSMEVLIKTYEAEPNLTKMAKELGVSDNAVKKHMKLRGYICKRS